MEPTDRATPQPNSAGVRKPYSKPHVQIYGDLRELTNTIGNQGAIDGGQQPTGKSHA
jgi:hypothetical protein